MKESYSNSEKQKKTMESPFADTVYYVSSDQDDNALVGMDVELTDDNISWFDTIKERRMPVTEVTTTNGVINVTVTEEDAPPKVYQFSPMTLDVYNATVKGRLLSGNDFKDEASLHEAFKRTKSSAW